MVEGPWFVKNDQRAIISSLDSMDGRAKYNYSNNSKAMSIWCSRSGISGRKVKTMNKFRKSLIKEIFEMGLDHIIRQDLKWKMTKKNWFIDSGRLTNPRLTGLTRELWLVEINKSPPNQDQHDLIEVANLLNSNSMEIVWRGRDKVCYDKVEIFIENGKIPIQSGFSRR